MRAPSGLSLGWNEAHNNLRRIAAALERIAAALEKQAPGADEGDINRGGLNEASTGGPGDRRGAVSRRRAVGWSPSIGRLAPTFAAPHYKGRSKPKLSPADEAAREYRELKAARGCCEGCGDPRPKSAPASVRLCDDCRKARS